MRNFISLGLLSLLIFSTRALAQSTVYSQQVSSGQTYEVTLTPQDAAVRTVSLWMISSGNETLPVKVLLAGPQGLKATLSAKQIANKNVAAAALSNTKGWWRLPKGNSTLAASAARYEVAAAGLCDGMSAGEIAELLEFFAMIYGRAVTQREICGDYDPGNPDNPGDPSDPQTPDGYGAYDEFTSILLKDSCKARARSHYLVKLDLDLSAVDRSSQQNILIQSKMVARRYAGARQSTLKPVSEGRFAPAPLLLMRALGGFGWGGVSERMYLNKWGRGQPRKNLKINTPQYLYYSGMVFVEGLPGSYLRGGKASATVSNDTTGYSICLRLSRTRQKFNGYP